MNCIRGEVSTKTVPLREELGTTLKPSARAERK